MSLYLPEQKLGSHSSEGSSSNKFMLKGRQTGSLHRGHSWVFRAESYDTMMAWYEDIKSLTEAAPQERNAFVRSHARSFSGNSHKASSISSDGVMDEEDEEPFSTNNSAVVQHAGRQETKRPEPGGRFPSDIQVDPTRGLQVPLSSSSVSSIGNHEDREAISAAADLPGSGIGEHYPAQRRQSQRSASYGHGAANTETSHAIELDHNAQRDGLNPYTYQPLSNQLNNDGLDRSNDGQGEHIRSSHTDPNTMAAIVASNTLYNSQTPDNASKVEYESLPQQVIVEKDAHGYNDASQDVEDSVSYVTGKEDILPIPAQGVHVDQVIPATSHGLRDEPAVQHENTPVPTATFTETDKSGSTFANFDGHPHEHSLNGSSMHVPGEYPQPTPIEEESSVKFA